MDASTGFDPSSRRKLTPRDLDRFAGNTLFDRLGRVLSEADCLPRKELFESWEVARRARRRMRGGRVVDLACGHGLLAYVMLLLDDTSPSALAVDERVVPSAPRVAEALCAAWPRLRGRVSMVSQDLGSLVLEPTDVVVAAHACGSLTDRVLDRAIAARARVAVLPCCQDERTCDPGGLGGWLEFALAVDVTRAARLRAAGYVVHTQALPAAITAKNRLLLASPA